MTGKKKKQGENAPPVKYRIKGKFCKRDAFKKYLKETTGASIDIYDIVYRNEQKECRDKQVKFVVDDTLIEISKEVQELERKTFLFLKHSEAIDFISEIPLNKYSVFVNGKKSSKPQLSLEIVSIIMEYSFAFYYVNLQITPTAIIFDYDETEYEEAVNKGIQGLVYDKYGNAFMIKS